MRNLKKVLSLTLALVMMLGMMTFAGAAETTKKVTTSADLTDMDKVVNKEAVSLLVDLKIVAGRETGAFDPTGTLTRAEFSKMIYVAKMGADDKAANFVGAATGLTDTKMWAEGYINYCFSTGIVAGRSATIFDPEGKLKTVEAAKMLLVALGYDSEAQGYVKDSLWSVNVMQDAKKNGLMDGVKDASDAFLSRDSAAQMIMNALFAKTVTNERQKDFTGKWYISKTTQNLTTLGEEVFNLAKFTGILLENEATAGAKGVSTIGNLNVDGDGFVLTSPKVASKLEDMGKQVTFYKNSVTNAVYSANVALGSKNKVVAVPSNLVASVTDPATEKSIASWLSENGLTLSANHVAKFVNYMKQTSAALTNSNLAGVTAAQSAYVIDANGDGVIDSFAVNTQTIDFVTGDVKFATSGDTKTVYVPGVIGSYTDVAKVVGYEDLKKDDVVFTTTVGTTTYIEKAVSVSGKLTGANTSAGKIYLDGKVYEMSNIADARFDTAAEVVALGYDKNITLWLDAAGKIAFAKTEAAAATAKIAYVIGYKAAVADGITDAQATAKLLFLDGSVETVTVSSDSTTIPDIDFDATVTTGPVATAKTYDLVTYTVDDKGQYVLKDATAEGYTVSAYLTGAIANNKASGIMGVTGGVVGTSDTVFITANYNEGKTLFSSYTSVTGIAKAPTYTSAKGYVISKGNIAKLVLIVEGAPSNVGTGDYMYTNAYNDATYNAANKTFTIQAFINGVKENVAIDKKVYDATIDHNGLYKITVTDKIVTGASDAEAAQVVDGVGVSYAGGVIGANTTDATAANRGYYTHNTDTVVYYVDGDVATVISPDAIKDDTNDTVSVWANSTTLVANIVVITKVGVPPLDTAELFKALFTANKITYGLHATPATAVTNVADNDLAVDDADGVWTAIAVDANNSFAFDMKIAASKHLRVTLKVESSNDTNTAVSPAITLVAGASTAAVQVTSAVADHTLYEVLNAAGDKLKFTFTVTDGTTEFVKTFTADLT